MTDGFIDFDPGSVFQFSRLARKFGMIGPHLLDIGAEAIAKYYLRVLKTELPPWIYVTRKMAYPPTGWFSEKQRRFVMAEISDGAIRIPYPRRSPGGGLMAGWEMIGTGMDLILINREPVAPFAYGEMQARQLALVGWPRLSVIVEEKERNANDAGIRAIEKEVGRVMESG